MLQSLRLLIDIQRVDDEITAVGRDLDHLPEQREELTRQVESAREAVAAATELLHAEEHEERQLEAQMRDQEALIAHLNGQTGQVSSTHAYEALQHEIEQAGAASSSCETKALELMEAIDEATGSLEAARRQLSELEESLPARLAEIDERQHEIEAHAATLRERRDKECRQLEPEVLQRYEQLSLKLHPTVAVFTGGACPACRIALPPQLVIDIRRADAVQACGRCRRLLVPESALTGEA